MTVTNEMPLGRLMVMAGEGSEAAKKELETRRMQNAAWYQKNKADLFRKVER